MTHESFYCLIFEIIILLQYFFLLFPPSKSSDIPVPLSIKLWPLFFSLIIIYGRNSWPKVVWKDWSDICQEKLMSTMWWISEELKLVLSWHANRSWMKRPRQKRKDLWKQFMWRLLPTFILQVNGGLQHRNIEINSLPMFLLNLVLLWIYVNMCLYMEKSEDNFVDSVVSFQL